MNKRMELMQFKTKLCPKRKEIFKKIIYNEKNDIITGGLHHGLGFNINWQDGAIKDGRNGATISEILLVCMDRLIDYENTRFDCDDNHKAFIYINKALECLNNRVKERKKRMVYGKPIP